MLSFVALMMALAPIARGQHVVDPRTVLPTEPFQLQEWKDPHNCFCSSMVMYPCDQAGSDSWWNVVEISADLSFRLRENKSPYNVFCSAMVMYNEDAGDDSWWRIVDFHDGQWFRLQEKKSPNNVFCSAVTMYNYGGAGADSWWHIHGAQRPTTTPPVGIWNMVMCHVGGSFDEEVTRSTSGTHSSSENREFGLSVQAGISSPSVPFAPTVSASVTASVSHSFGSQISQESGTSESRTVHCQKSGCLYQYIISGGGDTWNSPYTACTQSSQPPPCPPLTVINGDNECVEGMYLMLASIGGTAWPWLVASFIVSAVTAAAWRGTKARVGTSATPLLTA